MASASVQRDRQGSQGEAPDVKVCWSADRNSAWPREKLPWVACLELLAECLDIRGG